MCGLAGAIGYVDDRVADAVARMNAAQHHRGPDADGCFRLDVNASNGHGVVLAHRRLSIIDLEEHANQPMHDRDGGNIIVYNGEVYNYRELRRELEAEGATFKTSSDTEVVLKAFSRWGDACASRFRGMFALAVWNARQHTVTLIRDRMGIKPLYVARVNCGGERTWLFASELRAMLASGLIERRLCAAALETYLWHGFVVGRQSIVNGVEVLAAGSIMRLSLDSPPETRRYWSLETVEQPSMSDPAALGEELRRAVDMRLVADVPLGVFLSGGVDSSAVTALAARTASSPVRTFNIAFAEDGFDESQHARAVAQRLDTDHHEIHLSQAMFRDGLDGALASIDQPTFDAINTYFVSRAVREAGLTVALAGTGGDELFGGYRSFADIPRAMRWSRRLAALPGPIREAVVRGVMRIKAGGGGAVPPQTRWGKFHDVIATSGDLLHLYQVSYGLFTRAFLQELSPAHNDAARFGLPPAVEAEWRRAIASTSVLAAVSRLELESFIGQRLLRDTDAASMAVSLEVRVPLLDHRVVEEADRLAPSIRYDPLGRKDLLKRLAMPDLDPALFDRPKAGFVLPIEQWSRTALREQVDAAMRDGRLCESTGLQADAVLRLWQAFQDDAPGLYWSRIWAIFVLLWWCREHRVSL